MSVDWLSAPQRKKVEDALKSLYEEAAGTCVIFQWSNFLSNEMLAHLGLDSGFVLLPDAACAEPQGIEGGGDSQGSVHFCAVAWSELEKVQRGDRRRDASKHTPPGDSMDPLWSEGHMAFVGKFLLFDEAMHHRKFLEQARTLLSFPHFLLPSSTPHGEL